MTSHQKAHAHPCPSCAVLRNALNTEKSRCERHAQLTQDYATENMNLRNDMHRFHQHAAMVVVVAVLASFCAGVVVGGITPV